MASTEVEEPSGKTWVLRVSIHCEGCKRKVKKLLQSLPGVHDIEIETKQQRVVVKGDVLPETLIKKLVKAGKHAELWPEKADKIPRNFNPAEINSQKSEKASINEESAVPGKESKPPETKAEIPVRDSSETSKTTVPGGVPAGSGGRGGGKVDEGVGKSEVVGGGGKVAVEVKVEEKKPETGSAGNQTSQPVVEKKEEQTEKNDGVIGGGAAGGEGKKKKKKKGPNINKSGIGETSSSAPPPVIGGSPNHNGGGSPPPATLPSNQIPPQHHGYHYPPPHYYAPPPAPVYTVSYNTAHPPVNSHTASYYAAPPPHSYAYSHFGSEMEPPPPHPPSDFDPYTQRPLDSFEMFSDENPNGCLVM